LLGDGNIADYLGIQKHIEFGEVISESFRKIDKNIRFLKKPVLSVTDEQIASLNKSAENPIFAYVPYANESLAALRLWTDSKVYLPIIA
jgi:hypothetical protein